MAFTVLLSKPAQLHGKPDSVVLRRRSCVQTLDCTLPREDVGAAGPRDRRGCREPFCLRGVATLP